MQNHEKYAHIAGWGADLAHADRPAYPMERTPPRLANVHWSDPPEPQVPYVEVLLSKERAHMTPVFGSPTPPRGVSGSIRRVAFGFSESDLRHWLLLLFADRVNVAEGLVEDIARGHLPRIFSEMGVAAELRHNPRGAARNVLAGAVVLGAFFMWTRQRRRASR